MIKHIRNALAKIKKRFKKKVVISDRRATILAVEDTLRQIPGALVGDEVAPLKHIFVDGAYVRQITMPKGMLLTSKIHKIEHPYFIMQGDVSVLTEDGAIRLKAPYYGITKPGTKRVLYMHEDTVWVTVHVTKHRNLKKIEKQIIAKNYDELPEWVEKRFNEIQCVGERREIE